MIASFLHVFKRLKSIQGLVREFKYQPESNIKLGKDNAYFAGFIDSNLKIECERDKHGIVWCGFIFRSKEDILIKIKS